MAASRSRNLPEDARTDDVALIFGDQVPVGAFVEINVEVVEPEIGENLFELAVAVDRAQQLAFREIARDHLLRAVGQLDFTAQFGQARRQTTAAAFRGEGRQ